MTTVTITATSGFGGYGDHAEFIIGHGGHGGPARKEGKVVKLCLRDFFVQRNHHRHSARSAFHAALPLPYPRPL